MLDYWGRETSTLDVREVTLEGVVEVLKEEEFAEDKAAAGALTSRFSVVPRVRDSRVEQVELSVVEHFHGGAAATRSKPFPAPEDLHRFLRLLETAIAAEMPTFAWEEYDLAVDGEAPVQLRDAQLVLHLWKAQPQAQISFDDIYELEGYSERIAGIGLAKPIYVPLLQKPSEDQERKPSWLPGDLTPMVRVTLAGHEGQVAIPLSKQWVEQFQAEVEAAEASGADHVRNASLPTSVCTPEARALVQGFQAMLDAEKTVKVEGSGEAKKSAGKRESLLVKMNFQGIDYEEARKATLSLAPESQAILPRSLRPAIALKKHQLFGIAWFQHLVSHAPKDCRGALLADDMGLGKTLQLLCMLAWYYEKHPNAAPSLILAPKSLVDNWAAETRKFFTESFPEVLVLYGDELKSRKQPLGLIDQKLRERGIVELLRPSWAGTAKVIITTYEVLTNFEFSLARQPLAFVICDEAQRIKTPGTQVSIAARALKADFKIACTGTPVENTLADLWCLFDFVQPGLLGGLQEFGLTYRRPIECATDESRAALARLKAAISPQTLRRTKYDIRDELKKKLFAHRPLHAAEVGFKEVLEGDERLEVLISEHQSFLYQGGLKKLQNASQEEDGRKRARLSFGALHLMKAICAEPYCLPGAKFLPDTRGRKVHLANSPKLEWLLAQLQCIKAADEKAIVFTELREVQAALFYFMKSSFGLTPTIINGDSQNRQAHIERFSDTPGFNVIILSTLAAGAGLNVTAANHVIHFSRAWNPSKENQATDRAYRIGQTRDVHVYCPIVVSQKEGFTTFDVHLDHLLSRKAGLVDATVGSSALESMLNGTGNDVSFTELMGGAAGAWASGAPPPRCLLTMDDVDRMDGFRFEVLCRLLWSREGYMSQLTAKRGGDGGIDVVCIRRTEGVLLQCKSSSKREVGWDAIKEVTTGAALYQLRYAGVAFRRLAVTNQRFTSGAREHARANGVTLVERGKLEEMLVSNPIDNHGFEDEVASAVPLLDAA